MEGWGHEGNPVGAKVPSKHKGAHVHGGDVPSSLWRRLIVAGPDMGCRWEDTKGPHQIPHPQHTAWPLYS